MKKLLRYIPLLTLLVMVSCTTTEEGMNRTEVLQVSTNKIDIDALGEKKVLIVRSLCDWSAEVSYKGDDTDWIELSSKEGKAGTKDLSVAIDENKSTDDRSAVITISNDRYNLSQSIEIHQKAGEPFILLDQSEKEVAADGEVLEIIVNSNIDYTISSSESWARTAFSSASKGEKKISIAVDSSPVVESRSATITLSGKEHDVSATFKIIQQQFAPFIDIDAKYINCEAEGETVSIAIESNISWNASCTSDWLTITPATGEKGTSTFGVEVAANPMTTIREAVINVSNAEYNIEKQVTITQKALVPRLSVNTEPISATAEGRTRDINIDANISWQASCDADWVTITPTNGKQGFSILTVVVALNTNTTSRKAVIKVSNSVYDIEKQIPISQDAMPVNAILYTSSYKVTPSSADAFGASIVSNTYENGQGTIVFDAPIAHIGYHAFKDCTTLQSIVIPDSVTSIGDGAFWNCASLTSVNIPDRVTLIGISAFRGCSALQSITIPDSVTSIGNYTFYGCSALQSITIPDSVTSIGESAFHGCSALQSITIPDSVTSIGERAFNSCDALQTITIPNSVTLIGDGVFYGCSALQSITIPDSITSIGDSAFNYCSALQSIVIPDSVTSIGNDAFAHCDALQSITIPDSVTSIGDFAFYDCDALQSITIPDSVTSIGEYAFYDCSALQSITIPDSVTSIGGRAFYNCDALQSITIPDSVTWIGKEAFYSCDALQSITIPDSVTLIGKEAFRGCNRLVSVYCKAATPPSLGDRPFDNNTSGFKIYVPVASVNAYKSASGWSTYATYIVGYNF